MSEPTSRDLLQAGRWVRYAKRRFTSVDELNSWNETEIENLFTYRRSQITDYMLVHHGGFSFDADRVYKSYSDVIRDLVLAAIRLALEEEES